MVIYSENAILKQKEVLNNLIDVNTDVLSEYEAQKIIQDLLIKAKTEHDFGNYCVSNYIVDTTKIKWKSNPKSEQDYFVKIYFNEIEYATKEYELTNLEVSFLYLISKYLAWECNLLIDDEGYPIDQKKLCKLSGMNRNKVSSAVKSLEHKKCMLRIWSGKHTFYLVNPSLMFKGVNINKSIPKLFEMIGYVDSKKAKKLKK